MEPTIAATPAGQSSELLEVLHREWGRLGVRLEARREELGELVDVCARRRHDGGAGERCRRRGRLETLRGHQRVGAELLAVERRDHRHARHRQLALLAIGVPRGDGVTDLHIEVTRDPEPQRDLVRGARQPARLDTDVERPAEVLDRVPVDLGALDRQRCARRVGHVADEGVVEDLVLELLDRHIGDADVVRDGGPGGGADQSIEAGDEHQAGDDAGDPDHRAGDRGAHRHGAGTPARLQREPEAEDRRGRAPDAGDAVHDGALPHRGIGATRSAERAGEGRGGEDADEHRHDADGEDRHVRRRAGVRLVEVDGSDRFDPRRPRGHRSWRGSSRAPAGSRPDRRRAAVCCARVSPSASSTSRARAVPVWCRARAWMIAMPPTTAVDKAKIISARPSRIAVLSTAACVDRRVEGVDHGELGGLGRERCGPRRAPRRRLGTPSKPAAPSSRLTK